MALICNTWWAPSRVHCIFFVRLCLVLISESGFSYLTSIGLIRPLTFVIVNNISLIVDIVIQPRNLRPSPSSVTLSPSLVSFVRASLVSPCQSFDLALSNTLAKASPKAVFTFWNLLPIWNQSKTHSRVLHSGFMMDKTDHYWHHLPIQSPSFPETCLAWEQHWLDKSWWFVDCHPLRKQHKSY